MDMTQLQVGKLLLTQVKIPCLGINFINLGGLPVVLILGPWIANLLTHIVQPQPITNWGVEFSQFHLF